MKAVARSLMLASAMLASILPAVTSAQEQLEISPHRWSVVTASNGSMTLELEGDGTPPFPDPNLDPLCIVFAPEAWDDPATPPAVTYYGADSSSVTRNSDTSITLAFDATKPWVLQSSICVPTTTQVWPPPVGDYKLHVTDGITLWSGRLHIRPPEPVVTSVSPTSVSREVETEITLGGTHLDEASAVYLQSGASGLHLPIVSRSSTSVVCTVPAGAAVGSYTLRVQNRGGVSYETIELEVEEDADPTPIVNRIQTSSIPRTDVLQVGTAFGTLLRIRGAHLAGLDSVKLRPVNYRSGSNSEVTLGIGSVDGGGQYANVSVPASVTPDVYDVIAEVDGRANRTSKMKLVVADASASGYYPVTDHSVRRVSASLVVVTPTSSGGSSLDSYYAALKEGELVYLYNMEQDRVVVSKAVPPLEVPDSARQEGIGLGLGLEWQLEWGEQDEARLLLDHLVAPTGSVTALSGLSFGSSSTESTATFSFEYDGVAAFETTYRYDSAEPARLAQSFEYDTSLTFSGAGEEVYRLWMSELGIPTGFDHLLPCFAGTRLAWQNLTDAEANAQHRTSQTYSCGEYEFPAMCFVDGDGVVGLSVDFADMVDNQSTEMWHWRTFDGSTGFSFSAYPTKNGLESGAIGEIVYEVAEEEEHWTAVAEQLRDHFSTPPSKPTWYDDIAGVFSFLTSSSAPVGGELAEELMEEVFLPGAIPTALRGTVLCYFSLPQKDSAPPNETEPAFEASTAFDDAAEYVADDSGLDWRISPYLITRQVNESSSIATTTMLDHALHDYSKDLGEVTVRFYDEGLDGGEYAPELGDDRVVNLSYEPLRSALIDEWTGAESPEDFEYDAPYLDFTYQFQAFGDLNTSNASDTAGVVDLIDETLVAFADGDPAVPSGELRSFASVEAGQGFSGEYLGTGRALDLDVFDGLFRRGSISLAAPFGEFLFAGRCRGYAQPNVSVPGDTDTAFYVQEWARLVHGLLPSTGLHGLPVYSSVYAPGSDARRAVVQGLETIAWDALVGIETINSSVAEWADAGTVRVVLVGGTEVFVVTESWIAKRLVCDMFWRYGARSPTETELSTFEAKLQMNPLTVVAVASEIRRQFEESPNGSPSSRLEFREDVVTVFDEYFLGF